MKINYYLCNTIMMNNGKHIKEHLAIAGLKSTPQRMFILQYMIDTHSHPTVDEVYKNVLLMLPGISKATVYSVLESCSDKGILQKMSCKDGKLRYDFEHDKHHHLYDVDSGEIVDYSDKELDGVVASYFEDRLLEGYRIVDVKLEIKVKKETKL